MDPKILNVFNRNDIKINLLKQIGAYIWILMTMNKKHQIRSIILFVLLLIEVLSATHWQLSMSIQWCRWWHIAAGLGFVGLLFLRPLQGRDVLHKSNQRWLPIMLWAILVLWLTPGFYKLFKEHPLDFTHADMLPVIEVMVHRWLDGLPVYDMIPQFWNGVMPVYLPAMWLPYVPAIVFSFDMRLVNLIGIFLVLLYLLIRKKSTPWAYAVFIPIGLWFNYLRHNRQETFLLTQEGVVYVYYILLVIALYSRKAVLAGTALGLCLLSRYGILFFSISLVICYYLHEPSIYWKKLILSVGITGLALMTITGAWANLHIFIGLPGEYINNMVNFKAKYQDVMNDGLGLVPMIPIEYITMIYRGMVCLLIFIAIAMIGALKKYDHRFYYLSFLKLTLIVFYNLMIIPYQYLIFTSVWVSITIWYLYINHEEELVVPIPE